MTTFHPDLYPRAHFLPRSVRPGLIVRMLRLRSGVRRLTGLPAVAKVPVVEGVTIQDIFIHGPDGAAPIRVRTYRPQRTHQPVPALLWIHGGGFVMGDSEIDQANNIALVRELGIMIAAVNYRLAPQHVFPAPLDDCYAALHWLHTQARGVVPGRIAVGGASAGGGLAAGLAQLAHDRNEIPLAFQLLIYPMLDDRTTLRTDVEESRLRMWNTTCNEFGWRAYLGTAPGSAEVKPYAAPARREDLSGLPAAWIGVGTCDLFHDEDLSYAQRLTQLGVPCEVCVVSGAYHGFDVLSPEANVVQEFRRDYVAALQRALLS
jgi:acetyl esterase/lipase